MQRSIRRLPSDAMNAKVAIHSLVLSLPVAVPTGALHAQTEKEQLEEARKEINKHTEEGIQTAGDICVALQTPESTTVLLEVLDWRGVYGLSAAHYRDVVWESLLRITDTEARQAVIAALKKSRKNPLARMWLVKLIGLWGEADMGKPVEKLLSDKDVTVVREATRAMGRLNYQLAVKKLNRLVKHKDFIVRSDAIESLARIDAEEYRKTFTAGLRDREPTVRCALLGAATDIYSEDEVETWSTEALGDEDWRPRMQAVQNLAGIRTKSSVDSLIRGSGDARPVISVFATDELQAMTGMKWTRQNQWESWWKENRETFELPAGRQVVERVDDERSRTVYNGIPIVSDHVAFLIDKSRWMRERLEVKGLSKDEAAFAELEQTLKRLEGKLTFNVYTYNDDRETFSKKSVPLDAKSRKKALSFVDKTRLSGNKNLWAVLEEVIIDPTIDTVYLLTSGEPDVGLYVHGNRIAESLADINRFQKVVLHAIAYSKKGYWRHIRAIAEATGGQFEGFQ